LWFGGMQVIHFEMTLGVFAGFLAIRGLLAGPLASILGTFEGWLQFKSVLTRTDELSAQAPIAYGTRSADSLAGRLELRDVSFRYSSGSPWVLRNVSMTVEPGEHVALIGPSGQGKSTLLRIMSGIVAPTEGRVLLDGVDLHELDASSLARKLGTLVGEPLILEGTVKDNIVLRLPDEGDEAVCAAARAACFSEVVARMPQGYETYLEPQGANLSGGERQRLGLAQAMLGNPDLLFLDEATCFLDANTEARVIEATSSAGITVVSVAHRPAVIGASSQVFLVENGRVSLARGDELQDPHAAFRAPAQVHVLMSAPSAA
jgi:ATP-binding cassette subfamily B protein RaxB